MHTCPFAVLSGEMGWKGTWTPPKFPCFPRFVTVVNSCYMLSLRVANLKSRNYLGLSTSEWFRFIFLLLNFSWPGATCRMFSVCSHWQSKHHSSLTAVLRRECSPRYCHPKCPGLLPQTGTPPLPSAAGNALQPELGTAGAMKTIHPSWLFGPWLLWGFPKKSGNANYTAPLRCASCQLWEQIWASLFSGKTIK